MWFRSNLYLLIEAISSVGNQDYHLHSGSVPTTHPTSCLVDAGCGGGLGQCLLRRGKALQHFLHIPSDGEASQNEAPKLKAVEAPKP